MEETKKRILTDIIAHRNRSLCYSPVGNWIGLSTLISFNSTGGIAAMTDMTPAIKEIEAQMLQVNT